MNANRTSRNLLYISLIYGALYLAFIFSGDFGGALPDLNAEGISVYTLFLLFLTGLAFIRINKMVTGILYLVWNVFMWILELFIAQGPGGFGIISGIPLLVLGTFFIMEAEAEKKKRALSTAEQWRMAARILSLAFTVLYLIVVIDDITGHLRINYFKGHGLFLLLLMVIYAAGFVFSWISELYAGIIFIFWSSFQPIT